MTRSPLLRILVALLCAATAAGCNLFGASDDFRAPSVELTSPDTTVANVAGQVYVRIEAEPRGTDNTIASAEIIVGSQRIGAAQPVTPASQTIQRPGLPPTLVRRRVFDYLLDTTTLPDGEHRLEAVAFDARGARGTSRSVLLRVRNGDGTGPAVRIVSPADGDSVRGRVSVVVRPEPGQPTPSQVDIIVDGYAIASFTQPPFEWVFDSFKFSVGAHRLQARASLGPSTRLSPPVNVIVRDTTVTVSDPTFGPTCQPIRCTRFRVSGLIGTPAGTALSLGGVLYAATSTGSLYGLNTSGQVVSLFQGAGDVAGPPLVANSDNVFVTDRAGRLHGFAPNGSRLWDPYEAGASSSSAPALAASGVLYYGDASGRLHAVSPSTGRAVSGFPVQVSNAAIAATPAVDRDNHLYVLSTDGRAYSFTASGQLRWASADNLGAGSFAPALTERTEGSRITTLYVVSRGGRLSAVAGATGLTAWSATLSGEPTSGPVVGPDGGIFVGTSTVLAAFNETIPGNGTRQRFVLALPEATWPTVDANGVIHVAAGTEIVSVGPGGTVAGRYLLGARVASPLTLTRGGVLVAQRADGIVVGLFLNAPLAQEKWPAYGRSARHTFRLGDDARD